MTSPGYADVQPAPDAPLHASTGPVVPAEQVNELAQAEVADNSSEDAGASEEASTANAETTTTAGSSSKSADKKQSSSK